MVGWIQSIGLVMDLNSRFQRRWRPERSEDHVVARGKANDAIGSSVDFMSMQPAQPKP